MGVYEEDKMNRGRACGKWIAGSGSVRSAGAEPGRTQSLQRPLQKPEKDVPANHANDANGFNHSSLA